MTVHVDPAQLDTFVSAMFRHADEGSWISLRAFRDDVDNAPPVANKPIAMNGDLAGIVKAAAAVAVRCARYDAPVVFCPPIATFSDKTEATEAALANGLALSVELDADAERARKRLEFLLGPATVVVASGGAYTDPKTGEAKPKLHVHWRLKEPTREPEAHKRLKQARGMATALVGGDASNKPVVHPIRWPGSVHRKAEPKLCQILQINPDAEIDLQSALATLLDIQPEFRKTEAASDRFAGGGEERGDAELVRALLAGEDYHGTLLALSMRYLKAGMVAGQVVATLRGIMQAVDPARRDNGQPGRWQARYDDIPRMVKQGQEKLGQPEQQAPLTADLIMFDDCRLDTEFFWAVEDILPRCSMMLIYARGGSGKTYLGTSLALGVGTGQWFDHPAEHGAVLVCAFERPQDTEDRLAALRDLFGYHDVPIALLKLGGHAMDQGICQLIIDAAAVLSGQASLPVRAILIDTVSAALAGAKEDDEGFGRLRRHGERIHAETGALVIWIHHEGKGDHMGPRGHLTLADGCMVWWHVEEHEDGSRVVHVAKANRGPDHVAIFAFKLVPFEAGRDRRGKAIQLCEVQRTNLEAALASPIRKTFGPLPEEPEAKLGKRQKLLLRLFHKLLARHPGGVDRATLRSHFVADLNDQRQREGKNELSPDSAAAIFRQTLSRLKDHVDEAGDVLVAHEA
jgi:AAA domain